MGLLDIEPADEHHNLPDAASSTSLTHEDVRATVRQEILAMAGSSANSMAAIELQPAPPSYDSSARLLDDDDTANALDDSNEDPENGKPQVEKAQKLAPLWQRIAFLVLVICIILCPFILMAVLGVTGHDPLRLGLLALFLLAAQTFGYFTVPLFMYLIHGEKAFETTPSTKPKPDQPDAAQQPTEEEPKADKDSSVGWPTYIMSHYWLANFLIFWLVMWAHFSSGDNTLVPRLNLAARFDGKITQHDALGTLTDCIYGRVPELNRNATIEDFTFCLTEMGMPKKWGSGS